MYVDKYELLNQVKNLLKEELTIVSYKNGIENLEIESIKENKIVLVAVNSMQKDIIESRLFEKIVNKFESIMNKKCEIEIIEKEEIEKKKSKKELKDERIENISHLNPKYTFENFIVGKNNEFAHAAAIAVSKETIKACNPLFIYGGTGLGKTHLMYAIGNEIIKNNSKTKVLYVTCEQFINELVWSIQNNGTGTENFRKKYRNVDVLLIDDIQFLSNKRLGQEEFFNTFNALYNDEKRIIISSDRPPKELEHLEERLIGRFNWGILSDISKPDYETRLAILRKKTEIENIIVDDYILSLIATKIDTNIRDLEGVFNKVLISSRLTRIPITIESTQKAINDLILQNEEIISEDYIVEVVAKYFRLETKDLKSSKRSKEIAYPRQIAMYLFKDILGNNYSQTGDYFGNRDHSTVIYGIRKIEKEIADNKNTKLIVESLKSIIKEKGSYR